MQMIVHHVIHPLFQFKDPLLGLCPLCELHFVLARFDVQPFAQWVIGAIGCLPLVGFAGNSI